VSAKFIVVSEAPEFVAREQALEVLVVRVARDSPGLTQVARLADPLPGYQHR